MDPGFSVGGHQPPTHLRFGENKRIVSGWEGGPPGSANDDEWKYDPEMFRNQFYPKAQFGLCLTYLKIIIKN